MSYGGVSNHKSVKSSWVDDDEDDIDDELFLKNSRKVPPPNTTQNAIAQLTAKKDIVESRTLASTERSLAMLRESEQVGIATAQDLALQREKLENTSRNLDTINATLRTTQKNIDGIKSVFSSIKNYWTSPKENKDIPAARPSSSAPSDLGQSSSVAPRISSQRVESDDQSNLGRVATHQEAIDRNLSLMSNNITNLRGLALNLGDEILEQNEMIDTMQYKAEKAGLTINKQNQQMNRLLGKK